MPQKKIRTRHRAGKELENLKSKLLGKKEELWREILHINIYNEKVKL
jgi:hypothetical protein